MRPLVLAGVLAASLSLGMGQAFAQTDPAAVAPRNPSAASAGLTASTPQPANRTVDQIDRKLLSEEKDRPHLPGQAPSPSKGGTSMGVKANTTKPPQR